MPENLEDEYDAHRMRSFLLHYNHERFSGKAENTKHEIEN